VFGRVLTVEMSPRSSRRGRVAQQPLGAQGERHHDGDVVSEPRRERAHRGHSLARQRAFGVNDLLRCSARAQSTYLLRALGFFLAGDDPRVRHIRLMVMS
jgi:hypothetical protein